MFSFYLERNRKDVELCIRKNQSSQREQAGYSTRLKMHRCCLCVENINKNNFRILK